jgi:hypothetical protein
MQSRPTFRLLWLAPILVRDSVRLSTHNNNNNNNNKQQQQQQQQ